MNSFHDGLENTKGKLFINLDGKYLLLYSAKDSPSRLGTIDHVSELFEWLLTLPEIENKNNLRPIPGCAYTEIQVGTYIEDFTTINDSKKLPTTCHYFARRNGKVIFWNKADPEEAKLALKELSQ